MSVPTNRSTRPCVLVVILGVAAGPLAAAEKIWMGLVDQRFETAENWLPEVPPGPGDTAVFAIPGNGGPIEVNSNHTFNAVRVADFVTEFVFQGDDTVHLTGMSSSASLEVVDGMFGIVSSPFSGLSGGTLAATQGTLVSTTALGFPFASLVVGRGGSLETPWTTVRTTANPLDAFSELRVEFGGSTANLGATTIDGYFIVDDATANSTTAVIDNGYALPGGGEDVRLWANGTWNVSGLATLADHQRAVVYFDTGGTANFADLDVGRQAGSNASLRLDTQLFGFARPTLTGGDVRLAVASDEVALDVLRGSLVHVENLTAAVEQDSSGEILVRGVSEGNILEGGVPVNRPAELIVDETLVVGDQGTGSLRVAAGGRVEARELLAAKRRGGTMAAPPTGSVHIEGPGSLVRVEEEFDVGVKGKAELVVENGGQVQAGNLIVTQSLGSQGDAFVRGAGTWVAAEDHIKVGAAGLGTMRIEQQALVSTARFRVANRNQNGDFSIVLGDGDVLVSDLDTRLVATDEVSIAGNGRGAMTIRDGAVVETPLMLIGIDQPESATQNGTLTLDGGRVETSAIEIFATGTLRGEGAIDHLNGLRAAMVANAGYVKLESIDAVDTGRLAIEGNYSQTAEGVLETSIVGILAGTHFGQLNVTGVATLSGTLRVLLDDGYSPTAGSAFEVLTAGGGFAATQFDTTELPLLAADLAWNVLYGPTSLTLQVARAAVPGDFDGDGDVDGEDFLRWQTSFGQNDGGDADGDGDTDGEDFLTWQTNFGQGGGTGAASVPEPTAAGLAVLLAVAATAARRTLLRDRR